MIFFFNPHMPHRILAFALLVLAPAAFAKDAPAPWLEVRSAHFLVLTDSNEKQARHVAGQLERMRLVFHATFPKAVDPAAPIVIIAVKNKREFQALEPAAYLAKGQLDLAGLFLRAPDKNYVLLRLDAQGEHPYATVYHEYTHLLLSDVGEWLPLWLNEGLAEFFQNTEIHDKDAQLGEASSDDILYLRQNKLIPLATLLAVDAKSPYYHEEQKGSVFYAESWALTHLLQINDNLAHTHRLADYVDLASKHVDAVTAGERAFGDLRQLQKALESYIAQSGFRYFRVPAALAVDEAAFQATPVAAPAADAVRADFLAYNDRGGEARALLATVLKDDPKSASARETMGYLEFRAGNFDAARDWYGQAVQLDSQSYLAHYYYAAISMRGGAGPKDGDTKGGQANEKEIEASLRTAIQLNPRFAPSYDALAMLYGMRHEKLDEAHFLNLQAAQLDPGNLNFRLNTASVLQEADRPKDAIAVLKAAAGLAKTPEEAASVEARIQELERFQAQRERFEAAAKQGRASYSGGGATATADVAAFSPPKHPTETPHGPRQVAKGVIQGVQCGDPSSLELKVEEGGKSVSLFSNNYYQIPFSAANFTPEGDIHPCTDLAGAKASIQYFATADKTVDGQILSIMLSK
jgi:Flp pilus assembly protein TadD